MAKIEMQIGKNGVSEGTIAWLKNAFQKHDFIKISVLKAAGHDREKIKEMADEIVKELGKDYSASIIGLKITLRKWKKSERKE